MFGCPNVRKTWSERSLFRIIKGDNEDIVNGLGDTELLGFMGHIRNTEINCVPKGVFIDPQRRMRMCSSNKSFSPFVSYY